jgi:hypothetical protein
MRSNHTSLNARLLFLCAVPAALCALVRPANACDPGQVKFAISQPPRSGNVPLYFQLTSTCVQNAPRRCAGQTPTNVGAGTTMQQKCHLLVDTINSTPTCGSTDAAFLVENVNCDDVTKPSFTVRDPNCPAGAENTFFFAIANYAQLLRTNTNTSGFLFGDYELDIITPDCPAWGAGQANLLDGVATGVPINPGSSGSSMTVVVDLTPTGGPLVFGGATTTMGQTADLVTSNILNNLRIGLVGTGVSCNQPTGHGRVIECSGPDGTHGIGLGVQADDTGFVRGSVAGPPAAITQVVATVDTPNAPLITDFVVRIGPTVPAAGSWAIAAAAVLVALVGLASLARRRARGISG